MFAEMMNSNEMMPRKRFTATISGLVSVTMKLSMKPSMFDAMGMRQAAMCHLHIRNTLDRTANSPDTAGDTTSSPSSAHSTASETKGLAKEYKANTSRYTKGSILTSRVARRSTTIILLAAFLWSGLSIG